MPGVPKSGDARQVHCPPPQVATAFSQPALVHGVPSGTGSPLQLPLPSHVAFCVQAPSSEQVVPCGATVSSHAPEPGLHSAMRQAPDGVQVVRVPVHLPPEHAGATTHLSPTAHAVPFGLLADAHGVPTAACALHVPTMQSESSALQSLGDEEHVPVEQIPATAAQPLPPQTLPSGTGASTQSPLTLLQVGTPWQSRCTHFTL